VKGEVKGAVGDAWTEADRDSELQVGLVGRSSVGAELLVLVLPSCSVLEWLGALEMLCMLEGRQGKTSCRKQADFLESRRKSETSRKC
jgi:hypothetical protein